MWQAAIIDFTNLYFLVQNGVLNDIRHLEGNSDKLLDELD